MERSNIFAQLLKRTPRASSLMIHLFLLLMVHATFAVLPEDVSATVISGPQRAMVIRVRFNDYPDASRFTQAEVQGFMDSELNTLWGNISYGGISITATVTPLLQLPDNRSLYIDDLPPCEPNPAWRPLGDLSCDSKYMKVLQDAVSAATANGVDFTDVVHVMVLMAETDPSQFHRGQANKCNLPIGPGGSSPLVGCAIFSENPSEDYPFFWGRWAHEMGHAFQQAGPAHPSNYNSNFELMDGLYPGQSGMFEKQENIAFPGWMPPAQYKLITVASGGDTAVITAEELVPNTVVEYQAIKVELTPDLYYMVSVRRRMNGDEIRPIPDEGVLIERVVVGANPWVTVQGKGGNRNLLWQEGDSFTSSADGVFIFVDKRLSDNAWQVTVRFQTAGQPDAMIRPWLSPPMETYETTDIWIDSSCNGYGTYQYGVRSSPPDVADTAIGNGDNPCANHENRVYARIRNIGTQTASDVRVHFDVTDPLGMGISGASGWALIGTVTAADFPDLATIPPGGFVDVYVPWTPSIALTSAELAAGNFNFHSCIRILIDAVAGELNTANQDGDAEQENIAQFYASPSSGGKGLPIDQVLHLRNDSIGSAKTFNLRWESNLPADWMLIVNDNNPVVEIPPGAMKDVPVRVVPNGPRVLGQIYQVKVAADFLQTLVSDVDPKDIHTEYKELGGATIEVRIADPSKINLTSQRGSNGVLVTGQLLPAPHPQMPIRIDLLDKRGHILGGQLVYTDKTGNFFTLLNPVVGARSVSATFIGEAFQQGAYSRAKIRKPLR